MSTTDKPIIFSAPMVRALLDGRKTMTRRVVKLPTKGEYVRPDMGGWAASKLGGGSCFRIGKDGSRIPVPEQPVIWNQTTGTCLGLKYEVGDLLWVRESFSDTRIAGLDIPYHYKADIRTKSESDDIRVAYGLKWQPSIHMPKIASRLTLEVTAVKLELLKDISRGDAMEEGCPFPNMAKGDDPRQWFRSLWESINGPGSWEANPWVVAVSFKVHKCNVSETPYLASPTEKAV